MIQTKWWNAWLDRFKENMINGTNRFESTLIDLLCISTQYQYTAYLIRDINTINSTEGWFVMLMNAMNSITNAPKSVEKSVTENLQQGVPSWVIIPALYYLGFLSIDFKSLPGDDNELKELAARAAGSKKSLVDWFIILLIEKPFTFEYDDKVPILRFQYSKLNEQKASILKLAEVIKPHYKSPILVMGER